MAKDPASRVERLEKAHLELQEKHAKSCDDISQMMKMLKILTKEKQTIETPNLHLETTPLRGTGGDTPYLQGFGLPHENPTTYALSSAAYPLNYRLLQIVKILRLVIREPVASANLVDPLAVPDLDELIRKRKLLQENALEKYELIEERMRAIEVIDIPRSLDVTELSLVSSLVIPHKFKTSTFNKYDGTKCPITHLTMYCLKCQPI